MLPVKRILALHHSRVIRISQRLCRGNQGIGHIQVSHGRKLDGCVFPAGALHSDGACGDHDIPALHVHVHTAAGSHADKCISPAQHQFLHGNGCRRSADARGGHAYLFPVQITGVCNILPAVRHQYRVVKMLCNLFTALRVSGHDDIPSHVSLPDL